MNNGRWIWVAILVSLASGGGLNGYEFVTDTPNNPSNEVLEERIQGLQRNDDQLRQEIKELTVRLNAHLEAQ